MGGVRRTVAVVGGMLWAAGLFGCPPPNGAGVVAEVPPSVSRTLHDIVSVVEANAALMDRALWSNSVSVKTHFTDEKGKKHDYPLDGSLLFQPPGNLRLDLRPSLGDQVMQVGSNAGAYWLWIELDVGTMWWGRHRHVGKPCTGTISVRPDQLAAALGLNGLPKPEEGLIGPVLRKGNTYDALLYLREGADGGYLLDREYLVRRRPPFLAEVIWFRDGLGRRSMSAFLEDYRQAWDDGPLVPHVVNIIWPLEEGKFTMWIDGARGLPGEKVSEKAFLRPDAETLPSGVERVIQVDADCDAAEEQDVSEVEWPAGVKGAPRPGCTTVVVVQRQGATVKGRSARIGPWQ